MALSTLYNRTKMTVSGTPGTGTITLGSAVAGFQTFAAAGVPNGATVSYVIEDASNTWEFGQGTYTSSGTTLARTIVLGSSNGGSAISATGAAMVYLTALATDLPVKTAPTFTILTSGTNATYSPPTGCTWIRGKMLGGGGGGAGAPGTTAGSSGGTTYWNTSSPASTSPVYAAGGGAGGTFQAGGAGGTTSGSGTAIIAAQGAPGSSAAFSKAGTSYSAGGVGGSTFLGGAGVGVNISNGTNAAANSGSGGAGGGASQSYDNGCGGGGGAGAYIEFVVTSPAGTYYYTIGSGGTGSTGNNSSGGYNGGNGGSGIIIIEEHYNW